MSNAENAGAAKRQPRARSRNGDARAAVIAAALKCFAARGYFGASMRDIAAEAEIALAGIYHHFASKQEILQAVMTMTIQDVFASTSASVQAISDDRPAEQLQALVRAWVEFHTVRQEDARVGASEVHCLEGEGRERVIALRDEQEALFVETIERGTRLGAFTTPYPREAARAILNMGIAVATWYKLDGDISPQGLAERYARLSLDMVGAIDAPR
ncbi:TetR family transcriptional regulator [Leucobacter albus]|uniref:TetR family transcriptional regulator n=1 Tax=Leucobacter albus TaxID=272210 RepID=A0ABW3TJY7_9MICO